MSLEAKIEVAKTERPFVNVAGYKFVTLDNLADRRASLREICAELDLKGTILLSTEGINLFLAGPAADVRRLLDFIACDPKLCDLEVKESYSESQPFNRMLIKIKTEIIAFGVEGIDPVGKASPKLAAQQLHDWLAAEEDVALLDVRNDYEIELGTFRQAIPIGVDHFRDFPQAVDQLPEELKKKRIVMFCTGGIRCEKAGPYMEAAGFENVFQLDGGILKYFEECGGDHYEGDCFVFDQRVSLDPQLRETDTVQCFACQAALTSDQQQSPLYIPGESCPNCHRPTEDRVRIACDERNAAIAAACRPLPGSTPYNNHRPLNVPRRCHGMTLIDFVCDLHGHIGRDEWQRVIDEGQMLYQGQPLAADSTVQEGQRLERVFPATVEPNVNVAIQILHEDEAIVVVNKPAPLPMHPCGRFNRNSLQYILSQVYTDVLRPAHRLDANTSGVVVLSRTRKIASLVQRQFEESRVAKFYLARVGGVPEEQVFSCHAGISRTPSDVGGRVVDENGLPAETRFRVMSSSDAESLVQAQPITGRTNQIRVHLWSMGLPIVGDRMYLPGGRMGGQQTLGMEDPPLCLHAHRIAFQHPLSGERVEFLAPPPAWVDMASR